MKGPSLDAIRKFKEQQERKKREEDEKKIQSKLSTLEHRAAQGDKKAKSELKRIEKVKEELNKPPEAKVKTREPPQEIKKQPQVSHKTKPVARVETDFEELMRLAKQNANQTKKPNQPPPPEEIKKIKKKDVAQPKSKSSLPVSQRSERQQQPKAPLPQSKSSLPQSKVSLPQSRVSQPQSKVSQQQQQIKVSQNFKPPPPTQARLQPQSYLKTPPPNPKLPAHIRLKLEQEHREKLQHQARLHQERMQQQRMSQQPQTSRQFRYPYHNNHHDDYDDDEEEDDYESDGFVVDEEDDDIQDEVRNTIRSVFRYDKRRCDLREQELDRQYRAIGRVSTFEDLEREERRASRLAAAEDARALRDEEERKRLKKLRLKK